MNKFKPSSLSTPLHFDSIKISKLKSFKLPHPPIDPTTPEKEENSFKEYKAYIVTFKCIEHPNWLPIRKIFFETFHPLIFNQITNGKNPIKICAEVYDEYKYEKVWLILDEKIKQVLQLERLCSKYQQNKIKQGRTI